jgi:molecular chaperone DnaJ
MNYAEACKILEIEAGLSEAEISKQFRKLAAKYHPDINKDPEAIQKSKQLSEAYQFLKDYKPSPVNGVGLDPNQWTGLHDDIHLDFIQNMFRNTIRGQGPKVYVGARPFKRRPQIQVETTINFTESVLGTVKKITLDRYGKCDRCVGAGTLAGGECATCEGKGHHDRRQGNMDVRISCWVCRGAGKERVACESCKGTGVTQSQTLTDIKIPPGVVDGQILRLPGGGDFIPELMSSEDAHLKVTVIADDELKIQGTDVVSNISLSLLEALQGQTREVRTVLGNREIHIPPGSKHQEEIVIANHGVGQVGNHLVKLEVSYPEDLTGLINFLQQCQYK